MSSALFSSLSQRILCRLMQAETCELNPHYRDDYRIARIAVSYAASGEYKLCSPHVAASYTVLGLHPEKVWAAIVARRKAVCGAAFSLWFGQGGDRLEDVSVPKKPPRSERFEWEEWQRLKKAIGAELVIPRRLERVDTTAMAASTVPDYRESDRQNSEKSRPFFSQDQVEKLIRRLDIPHYLRRTFEVWWRVCTAPDGREIQLFESLGAFARAADICERTARNHFRKFERLELMEIAVRSDGKRLVANSIRKSATYRLKTETLARNQWAECKRCGHQHASTSECGCSMGERNGRFRTKDGGVLRKTVHRTCRCKASRFAPTSIRRPQRSSHSPVRSSPPAQAAAASPAQPPTTAAPVHVAPTKEPRLGSRAFERVRDLRKALLGGMTHWMEQGLSQEDALAKVCRDWGVTEKEALEQLEGCHFKPPKPKPPTTPGKFASIPPPQLSPDRDPWQKILRALKAKINPHSFATWLSPTRCLGEQDGVLYVRIPTAEFRNIGEKYGDLIREAMNSLGMEYRDVQFEEAEPSP